jgi:vitamin B12 transporter
MMCRKSLIGALILVLLTFSPSLLAQGNPPAEQEKPQEKLEYEVTVTANRVETSVKETASSVTVITRQDLEKTRKTTVLEALAEVMGLSYTQNGPLGSSSSVQIRGANSEHTKVMIDGMELNDPMTPSRTFDMGLLLVESIDRVEIARGPQSTLYGSDAMGGVINIVTRQEQGKPRMHFSTQGGSYSTLNGNAEVSGRSGQVSYSAGAAYLESEGFSAAGSQYAGNSENDGYRNLTLSGKLGYHPRDNLDLGLTFRSIDSRLDIDNFGGDYGDDPNNVQDYNAVLLGGSARGLFASNRWESKLNLSYLQYERRQDNPPDEIHPLESERSLFKSDLLKLDWQNNVFAHENNTVTAGLAYSREQGESEYTSESIWGPYESLFPKQAADTFGAYIQDRVSLSGKFFAALGARYDHHSQAGGAVTFRIAPGVYFGRTGTRLKASLGTGFKAPSLYQLYAPATLYGPIGNENLEPERTLGWDLGVEQEFLQGRLRLGALYFSNSFENLIDFTYTDGYLNLKKASTRGAELFLRANPWNDLFLSAEYTRTEAKDEESGEYLLRRPKHKLALRIGTGFAAKGHVTADLLYVGEREDNFWVGYEPTRVTLDSYLLINAAASYEILPFLQVFGRLDNLLDQRYEVVKGYGTPGFSAYAGLRLGK